MLLDISNTIPTTYFKSQVGGKLSIRERYVLFIFVYTEPAKLDA